ncbi:hypothetical protein KSP40_PGU016549 [Platanthera guangdongensis]|uniref:Uncharacterized protein n=1 Tax=Platanthera guangdongensis TaxID=2320717 RepID=A0ABR2M396_9ASPA
MCHFSQNKSCSVVFILFTSSTSLKILLICLGVTAFVAITVFVFKLWQKKKRQEYFGTINFTNMLYYPAITTK